MVDLDKLKNVLRLCGALAVFLFGANFLLTLSTAIFPSLLPKQFFGVDFVEDNRQRAAAVASQYREGLIDDGDNLVVILGLSSASEGIQVSTLASRAGSHLRILSLCGAGRNMQEISRYASPLLDSDVRPDLAVFAISSFHLIDPLPLDRGFTNSLQSKRTRLEMLGFWYRSRRQDIKYAADIRLSDARAALFRFFDVYAPAQSGNPWRENVRMDLPVLQTNVEWETNLQRYGLRGYYDADAFRRSRMQLSTFIDLVAEFIARDSRVAIVLMPEHSSLRAKIPDEIVETLSDPLEHAFGSAKPPILDFRAAVPDSGFGDISHMNENGRVSFSAILADFIEHHRPGK